MPVVDANGLKIDCEVSGEPGAPAVLLIMGLGMPSALWPNPVVQTLTGAGYRVVTFDMSRRTVGANAALVGLGRTRSILIGDTLLSSFTDDEIETVLAHELAHHVHRDLAWAIALQGSLALVSFGLAASVLNGLVRRGTLAAPGDPAGLPHLALALAAAGLILLPLQNAFSRAQESRADAYAVHLTHRPRAYADALVRLANQNLAEVDPPRGSVILFATHPPLNERIRAALLAESRPGQPSVGS